MGGIQPGRLAPHALWASTGGLQTLRFPVSAFETNERARGDAPTADVMNWVFLASYFEIITHGSYRRPKFGDTEKYFAHIKSPTLR